MMDEVYEETLDVRTIVILISHDHDRPISKLLCIRILDTNFQTSDFEQILNFRIVHDLLCVCLSNIQHLSFQRETSIFVSGESLNTCICQWFGWVTFSQNEHTFFWFCCSCPVGVIEFVNSHHSLLLASCHLFEFVSILCFCYSNDCLDNSWIKVLL